MYTEYRILQEVIKYGLCIRINISSQMFDKTYEVYGISEGDAMYLAPDKRVLIWGE